jgi:hypothetical protein
MYLRVAALLLLTALAGAQASSQPGNVYRNASLGLTYKVRYGWVDRTSQMAGDDKAGKVLLAVFERPPEAIGDTINSAVTIASENISAYPGLKTAADYFGPVTELTKGLDLEAVNPPYEVTVGGRRLVRADFKKEIGALTMYWTSLAMIVKDQVVSFTLVGSNEDEIEDLAGRISFAPAANR